MSTMHWPRKIDRLCNRRRTRCPISCVPGMPGNLISTWGDARTTRWGLEAGCGGRREDRTARQQILTFLIGDERPYGHGRDVRSTHVARDPLSRQAHPCGLQAQYAKALLVGFLGRQEHGNHGLTGDLVSGSPATGGEKTKAPAEAGAGYKVICFAPCMQTKIRRFPWWRTIPH